jgi:hypothetical protein
MTPNFERLDRAFNRIIHPEPGDPGFYFGKLNADKSNSGFYKEHKSPSCGSFCCVLGGLPLYEKDWIWDDEGYPVTPYSNDPSQCAVDFFRLDDDHVNYLFFPVDEDGIGYDLVETYNSEPLYNNATPQQVYDNYIRFKEAYLKENLDKK